MGEKMARYWFGRLRLRMKRRPARTTERTYGASGRRPQGRSFGEGRAAGKRPQGRSFDRGRTAGKRPQGRSFGEGRAAGKRPQSWSFDGGRAPSTHARGGRARQYAHAPQVWRRRRLMRMCAAGCMAVLALCLVRLISYGADYVKARRASAELRAIYYEQEEPVAATPAQAAPTPTAMPSPTPEPSPAPSSTPATVLEPLAYPDNPYANVRTRFQKIQRQNADIIGWLTIDEMIDEAVVQRDNAYYLNRDYRGYHNVNGAIFLEETCDLSTRPYTLMLYGHNMKTGAMFGSLRNYENMTYYRNNPFITFDTAYEDGRYVIFAVSTVSLDRLDDRYVDFAKLNADWIDQRSEALDALMSCSLYRTALDVTPQDQLLLLITCVDDDEERRVVAARRLRPDETEESLAKAIEATTKR